MKRGAWKPAGICGLYCGACPKYPTQCEGCLSDRVASHCVTCKNGFRTCARERNVTRCFQCRDFPCDRLRDFTGAHIENGISHHARVIEDLQYMKDHGVERWVEVQEKAARCPGCGERLLWSDRECRACGKVKMLLGICGDRCDACPRYNATATDDAVLFEKIRSVYIRTGLRGEDASLQSLKCRGCLPENNCAHSSVRDCAFERKIDNCGRCPAYPCEQIEAVFRKTEEYREIFRRRCNDEEFAAFERAFFRKKEYLDAASSERGAGSKED